MEDSVERLPMTRLAQLLDLSRPARWTAADAAAALRQQLDAPLLPDLAAVPGARPEHLQTRIPETTTFLHALVIPSSIEILHAIKEWSRHLRGDDATPLAPGPATVFYYAAVAAALLHFDERITTLSDAQLAEGFAWAQAQPGAEALQTLFNRAHGNRIWP